MSEEKIASLEKICLENIQNKDQKEFELNYNLYSTFKGRSAYLKAYMLMLLLSQNRIIDYHKLVESISYEEVENEHIKTVLFIERCTNTGNLRKLEAFKTQCKYSEFIALTESILVLNRNSMDGNGKIKAEGLGFDDENEQLIKDSLCISLNSQLF